MDALVLTDRQLDLMNLLWDLGSATVREAKRRLDVELAYTSVLTIFQTLEKNGHVRHEEEGKAYRYYPNVSRSEAGSSWLQYVLQRIFGGSRFRMAEEAVAASVLPDEYVRAIEAVRTESRPYESGIHAE